jgi:uncharacterized membrane protein (DUF2068 family)
MASQKPAALLVIAFFKLAIAVFLALVSIGALQLLRPDIDELLYPWFDKIGFDTSKNYIDESLIRLLELSRWKVKLLSVAALGYSIIFLVEGFGIYFDQKWADLFTIIVTSGFIPFEVYELFVKANWTKIIIIVINLCIVIYLVYRLRQKRLNHLKEEPNIS